MKVRLVDEKHLMVTDAFSRRGAQLAMDCVFLLDCVNYPLHFYFTQLRAGNLDTSHSAKYQYLCREGSPFMRRPRYTVACGQWTERYMGGRQAYALVILRTMEAQNFDTESRWYDVGNIRTLRSPATSLSFDVDLNSSFRRQSCISTPRILCSKEDIEVQLATILRGSTGSVWLLNRLSLRRGGIDP